MLIGHNDAPAGSGGLPVAHDSFQENQQLRGERALAMLASLTTARMPAPYQRALVVSPLATCDCNGGAILRACIEAHLRSHAQNRAEIWEPKKPEIRSRVHDFLSPLPERCKLVEDHPLPARGADVVFPVSAVDETETVELLAYTILRGASALGITPSPARAVAQALAVLAENARQHGALSPVGALATCALESDTRELHTVVLDLGEGVASDSPDAHTGMREAFARSRERIGGLASLVEQAERRGLDVTLRLASGTARARWRGGRVRYDEGTAAPGFVASFSVRL